MIRVGSRSGSPTWYPLTFAAAFLLDFYVTSAVSPHAAVRPTLVALGIVSMIRLAAWLVLRDRHRSALVTLLSLVPLFFWADLDRARLVLERVPLLIPFALVIGVLVARLLPLVARGLRRQDDGWAVLSRRLDIVGLVLLSIGLVQALLAGAVEQTIRELPQAGAALTSERASGPPPGASPPDIVVLLLDGYPRADTLERLFDHDARPFLRALEQRGFSVAERSRSRYSLTPLTLASMFQMATIEDVPQVRPLYARFVRQGDAFRRALAESSGLRLLREHGYRVVVSHSGFEQVRIGAADVFLDGGQLNEYEWVLLQRSVLLPVLGTAAPLLLPEAHRARVRSGLDHLVAAATSPSDRPRFVFVHLPSPHTPLVFAADGSPVPIDDLTRSFDDSAQGRPISEETFRARMRGQVEWLDGQVLQAIDDILAAAEGPPVIVLFSDHGTGTRYDRDDLSRADVDERMSNLFAAYTPSRPEPFPANLTTIDVLPYLFDAYLGTHLPRHDGRTFLSKVREPLEYIEVPNPDREAPP